VMTVPGRVGATSACLVWEKNPIMTAEGKFTGYTHEGLQR
jgi:hypothetical protein